MPACQLHMPVAKSAIPRLEFADITCTVNVFCSVSLYLYVWPGLSFEILQVTPGCHSDMNGAVAASGPKSLLDICIDFFAAQLLSEARPPLSSSTQSISIVEYWLDLWHGAAYSQNVMSCSPRASRPRHCLQSV